MSNSSRSTPLPRPRPNKVLSGFAFAHHAYLVLASPSAGEALVHDLLERSGITLENNPDLHYFRGASFSIDEARMLRVRAGSRAFGAGAIFVILSERLNREAQNALLKTLEEPGEGNVFFVVAPYIDALLPTLRSRLHTLTAEASLAHDQPGPSAIVDQVSRFLALTPAKRLAYAKDFADNVASLGAFLDALLFAIRETGSTQLLRAVFALRRYADDPSANSRMIIEHLAFVI